MKKLNTSTKVLHILSNNSRISTKDIGKKLKISQQAASYHLTKIFENSEAVPLLLTDSARLSQVQILFGFVTKAREGRSTQMMLKELRDDPLVTTVLTGQFGFDLLLEYSANTVSAINKRHLELIEKHSDLLETKFIAPIVVKRWYGRELRSARTATIIAGDRESFTLTTTQQQVLDALSKDTRTPVSIIAQRTGSSIESVRTAIKSLESKRVIRGYSLSITPSDTQLRTQVFLRFSNDGVGQMDTFNELLAQMRSVVCVTKLLGDYHAMVHTENESIRSILDHFRSKMSIDDALVMPVRERLKERLYSG